MTTNRFLSMAPVNDGTLFDMLQGLFGLGDFDDDQMFWYKHRMREIAKLKAIRKKRAVSIGEMTLAARYCFMHRVQVRESYQLCAYIPEAKRELRLSRAGAIGDEIAQAVQVERDKAQPDQDLIDRLLLARANERSAVLTEWRELNEPRRPV